MANLPDVYGIVKKLVEMAAREGLAPQTSTPDLSMPRREPAAVGFPLHGPDGAEFEIKLEQASHGHRLVGVEDELLVDIVITEGRQPPIQNPFFLKAAILSRIRSAVTSRSNWAKESSTFNVSRPMELGGGVEERRCGLGSMGITPFPLPAHQTGRADFPHPASRPASPQSTRRWAKMDPTLSDHTELPEHDRIGETWCHATTPYGA